MSQLDELRQIIVGDNTDQLQALKRRLESVEARTRDVAEVLAPAIDENMRSDGRLVNALSTPISESLKRSIRAEPVAFANILYPAIAPSIKAAIAHAISTMMVTINQTIESATTVGGMRTRFESWRTGLPYAELLLRRTMEYRVEHVFLIERDSGLLISESRFEKDSSMDSDAISAMFSAIQSFVQESFSQDESGRLTDFKVGDYTVWIAHGPKAMLACVFIGDAPTELKSRLHATLDKIRIQYAQPLSDYRGNASDFEGVNSLMDEMLEAKVRSEVQDEESKIKVGPFIIYTMVLIGLGWWAYSAINQGSQLSSVSRLLSERPGIVLTDLRWQDDKIKIVGLRDPLAQIPMASIREYGITEDQLNLQLKPFRSLDPRIEAQRLVKTIDVPETAIVTVETGAVKLLGRVSNSWYAQHAGYLLTLVREGRLNMRELVVISEFPSKPQ